MIERQLRRTYKSVGGGTDPYWTSVSTLLLTNSSGNTNQRTSVFDTSGINTLALNTTANSTSVGGAGFVTLSPFAGKKGSYYSDGRYGGSGIRTNATSASNFSGDFTVECWVMTPTTVGGQSGFASPIINGNNTGFFASGPAANKYVAANYGGSLSYTITSTVTASDGIWRHLALVRNGTSTNNLRFYIDGVLIGSATGTAVTNYNFSNLCTGTGASSGPVGASDNQWVGYICNVRFSNVARYTSAFTSPTDYFTSDANTTLLFRGDSYAFYDASNNKIPMIQANPQSPIIQNSSVKKFTTLNSIQNSLSTTIPSTISQPRSIYTSYNSTINTLNTMPGDFTWECFVYISSATTQNAISVIFASDGLTVYSNTAASPNVFSYNLTGFGTINTTINSKDSAWHHLAIVRSGTGSNNTNFYIDGISQGTPASTSTTSISLGNFYIIGASNITNELIGYIDELRITKGVARYTANFTPPTNPFPTQ